MSIETTRPIESLPQVTDTPRRFLGWRIVGVAFLAQILANGSTLSVFGNMVLPLSEEFGVTRGTIAFGLPIAIAAMGLVGPFIGRWVDRGHVRIVMTTGAALTGAGLLLLSRTDDLLVFASLFGGMVCIGAALFGPMPSMTLVANWFVKRRGLALGMAVAGATLVGAVAPLVAQYLIDTSGWRSVPIWFGFLVLAIGVPVFGLLTVGRPEEVGQLPDGEEASPEAVAIGELRDVQDLALDPHVWLVSLGFGLILTSPLVLLGLLIPFGVGLGFSGQEANIFLVVMAPFSLFGKLAFGALADRAPLKPIIALVVFTNILVWLVFYSVPSYALYLAAGVAYGIGIGGAMPLHGVVLGRFFGRANFGTASGLGGILLIVLLVMVSVMSALLQGDGEGYPTIFLMQAGLLLLGGLVLGSLRIPSADQAVY